MGGRNNRKAHAFESMLSAAPETHLCSRSQTLGGHSRRPKRADNRNDLLDPPNAVSQAMLGRFDEWHLDLVQLVVMN